MDKYVDNKGCHSTVESKFSAEVIKRMKAALWVEQPRVNAYEVAQELGFDESAFSRLWRGSSKTLPHGIGPNAFFAAVQRIRARKAAAA